MAQIVATVAALAIVVQCLCSMNQMSRRTPHGARFAFLGLLVSVASMVLAPMYGYTTPAWPEAATLVAVAVFMVANKRRSFFTTPKL